MATRFTNSFESPVPKYGEGTAWKATQENPVYFITKPVGGDKDNFGSVDFIIESHDQGISSGNNFEGDYDGSVTWFEAWIVRGDNQLQDKLDVADRLVVKPTPPTKSPKTEETITDIDPKKTAPEIDTKETALDISQLYIVPNNDKSRSWYIQTNKRSNEDFFTHKITWSTTGDSAKQTLSEQNGFEFDRKTGAGFGRTFVKSLSKNDRIVVVARAKYAGSVNYVKSVKVEISTGGATPVPVSTESGKSDKRSWRDSFRFGKKK